MQHSNLYKSQYWSPKKKNYIMQKSSNVGARPRVAEREATTHYNYHLIWKIYLFKTPTTSCRRMDGKMEDMD